MIVYHGSNFVVVKPDVEYSRSSTDFSKGFYLTTNITQAKKWANRKYKSDKNAFVNEYELNENELKNLKVLKFDSYNKEWLEFVLKCRTKKDKSKYDVVIGPLADDRVYDTIGLYMDGYITFEQAIKKLKSFEANMQICIRNNKSIEKLLVFKKAEALYGK